MGTRQLFKRDDGSSITFHIILVPRRVSEELTPLIESLGGAVACNNDCEIIFCTKDLSFVAELQPGKRLYDVAYIHDCIRNIRFINPTYYRIGPDDVDDHRAIRTFLFKNPANNGVNNLAGGNGMHIRVPILPIDLPGQSRQDNLPINLPGQSRQDDLTINLPGQSRQDDIVEVGNVHYLQNRSGQGAPEELQDFWRRGPQISDDDSKQIVDFLLEHNLVEAAMRGLGVWKKFHEHGLFENRRVNSLYTHFRNKILPRIDRFTHLTDAQRERFRRLLNCGRNAAGTV